MFLQTCRDQCKAKLRISIHGNMMELEENKAQVINSKEMEIYVVSEKELKNSCLKVVQ